MADPSKVIYVRNVPGDVSEHDLQLLTQNFGTIQKLVLVRSKNQALVQLESVTEASNFIQYYSEVQPAIRNQKVYVQFSSHQELTAPESTSNRRTAPANDGGGGYEQIPNRILLVTIHNPAYPITVDVLQQVFSPHGFVEKVVTFNKSAGLQALLQFQTQQQAVSARTQLQGRNIYDGCCTLDIQFSNLQELQVHYNNDRTRDFTNNQLPEGNVNRGRESGRGSLFGDGGQAYNHRGVGYQQPGGPGNYQGLGGMGPYQITPTAAAVAAASGGVLPPGITGTNERCTLLVSGLNVEQVDADKLFNLFSNYGNIVRIKLLHNKPDHALLQMADPFQAELAVHNLRGVPLFGKKMEVNYSRFPTINPSPDTKEYFNSNLNRFSRNATKNYRHCCAPTRMLHLSSLPAEVTEAQIKEHLEADDAISGVKVMDKDGKKQALVLFNTPEEATETLVIKHGTQMENSTIRIAFSKNTSLS